MVRAWNLEDNESSQHLSEQTKLLSVGEVKERTATEVFQVDLDTLDKNQWYIDLKKDRGYKVEDEFTISRKIMTQEQIDQYTAEHRHDDEEIRLIIGGSGYIDVRDREDHWIRLQLQQGDLIILPPYIYHRFMWDKTATFFQMKRFFTNKAGWKSEPRIYPEKQAALSR